MDLFECLGDAVRAEFAARRDEVTRHLFVGDDAAQQLVGALAEEVRGRRAVVLADPRTAAVGGEAVLTGLRARGFEVTLHLLGEDGGHPVCDDVTHDALLATLPACDVLVAVGSGVLSDLVKWVAFERGIPGAVFATAASMNGYTAANVAPAIKGVKSLFSARSHRVIAADPRILAEAPAELTSAGLGDVIAKWVSTADWRMNHLLFGESFSEAVAGIIDSVEATFLARPEALAERSPAAAEGLFLALIYSGCAMTLQGSSMPASGGEHLISHALDMRASAHGVEHDLHGRQVGLGTITAAALLRQVATLESPTFDPSVAALDRAGWGGLAESVAPHRAKKERRMVDAVARLQQPGIWPQLRTIIADTVPTPERVKGVLKAAGAAHRVQDIGLDEETFLWAVRNGGHMRERFTSLDLASCTGVLGATASTIVRRYLTAP